MLLTRPAINVPESRNSVLKGSLEILSQAKNDMDASTSSDFDYEDAVVWEIK